MSGLSDNDFKDVVINMLQQTLRNTLETNKKLTNTPGPSILCMGGSRGVKSEQCDTALGTHEESSQFLNKQIKFRSF